MSEHWPVSNEGVGMPPQPLEKENARLRKALRDIDAYWIAGWPDEDDVAVIGDIARAALREAA